MMQTGTPWRDFKHNTIVGTQPDQHKLSLPIYIFQKLFLDQTLTARYIHTIVLELRHVSWYFDGTN